MTSNALLSRLALVLLLAGAAYAQTTTVTGTGIVDPHGNLYANGTVSINSLVVSGQQSVTFGPFPTDSTGSFSVNVTSNLNYRFKLCATPVLLGIPTTNPTPVQICFEAGPIFITGASQSVTVQLNAAAAVLGPALGSGGGGGGGGTVTSFSAGNLSPLFTTGVLTSTTTPALSFSLSNAAAGTIFGNLTTATGAPAYTSFGISGTKCYLFTGTGGQGCDTPSGVGTVTSFSSGNLSPLFTTSVTSATSTPSQTFSLSNANANTIYANLTGASAAPSFSQINGGVSCGDPTHALAYTNNTGFTCQAISTGGSPAFSSIVGGTNNGGNAMIVGSTSSLSTSGTGTITATNANINSVVVLGTTSAGAFKDDTSLFSLAVTGTAGFVRQDTSSPPIISIVPASGTKCYPFQGSGGTGCDSGGTVSSRTYDWTFGGPCQGGSPGTSFSFDTTNGPTLESCTAGELKGTIGITAGATNQIFYAVIPRIPSGQTGSYNTSLYFRTADLTTAHAISIPYSWGCAVIGTSTSNLAGLTFTSIGTMTLNPPSNATAQIISVNSPAAFTPTCAAGNQLVIKFTVSANTFTSDLQIESWYMNTQATL